jgi:hypothetical protein
MTDILISSNLHPAKLSSVILFNQGLQVTGNLCQDPILVFAATQIAQQKTTEVQIGIKNKFSMGLKGKFTGK